MDVQRFSSDCAFSSLRAMAAERDVHGTATRFEKLAQ